MDPYREKYVRSAARDFVDRLWDERASLWELPPPEAVHMVPIPVERIPGRLLSVHVREVAELAPLEDGSAVAGIWDPKKRLIEYAREFKPPVKRFTIAHEIGHVLLHPAMTEFHRTSPFESHAVSPGIQDSQEREANLFAAELLIPKPILDEIFRFLYGGPIFPSTIDDHLLYSLGAAKRRPMSLRAFIQMSPYDRGCLIAANSVVRGMPARSLAETFGVSVTAMAIQLGDSGLVS